MLKVPKKIKNFVWRACKDSIPTKINLRRRSIAVSPLCDRCTIEEENRLHALWSCRELDQVWSDSSGWGHWSTSDYVDFHELLSWILENHAQPELFANDSLDNMEPAKPDSTSCPELQYGLDY